MALLEVKNLGISFGGLRAVDDFNISVEHRQLYGLIGPNGAGKTTVFNLLTGVYKPTRGTFSLDGVVLTGKSPIEISRAGIARTFQNIRLFKNMTVLDNVKTGLHNHQKYTAIEGIFRLPRYFKEEAGMDEQAMDLRMCLDWMKKQIIWPVICPMGSSGSWRLPAHLQQTLSCCCWMNLRQE